MYVYICMYQYVYICVYMYTYTYIYKYVSYFTHTCTRSCLHTHAHANLFTYIVYTRSVDLLLALVEIAHSNVYISINVHMFILVERTRRVCACVHGVSYMQTLIHKPQLPEWRIIS